MTKLEKPAVVSLTRASSSLSGNRGSLSFGVSSPVNPLEMFITGKIIFMGVDGPLVIRGVPGLEPIWIRGVPGVEPICVRGILGLGLPNASWTGDVKAARGLELKSVRSPNLINCAISFTREEVHRLFVGSF